MSRILKLSATLVLLLVLAVAGILFAMGWSTQEPLYFRIVERRPLSAPASVGYGGGWEYLVEAVNVSDSSIVITTNTLRRQLPPGPAYMYHGVSVVDFLVAQVPPSDPTGRTYRSRTTAIPARSTRRYLARLPAGEQDFLSVGTFDIDYTFFTGSQYRVHRLTHRVGRLLPPHLAAKLDFPRMSSGRGAMGISFLSARPTPPTPPSDAGADAEE